MKWIYYNDIERFVHVQNHSLIRGDFERTVVWDNISSALYSGQWSGTRLDNGLDLVLSGVTSVWNSSDQRRLRAHFERTMIFERILVWSEVTSVWDGLIRGPTCLGRSDQGLFRARPQPGCHLFRQMSKAKLNHSNDIIFLFRYLLFQGERKGSRSKSKPTEKQAESYVIVM